jgi:hypothetical protein
MEANVQMEVIPEDGVRVFTEGNVVRLSFDFTEAEAPAGMDEKAEAPVTYNCYSVDVRSRQYGVIVAAIVKERYPIDVEQAVIANYEDAKEEGNTLSEEKRNEYVEEYEEYQAWRKHAKEVARIAVAKLEAL